MQSASPIAGNPASHPVSRSAEPSPSNASRRDRLRDFFRYHGIWAPGVRLFRRIGFQSKASILTAVFLVPIGLLSWQYFQDKAATIGFTHAERQGVQAMQHIVPVMKGVIDTRNATRALLGGYPAQADYQAARQATDQALASLAAHVQDSGDPLQIADCNAPGKPRPTPARASTNRGERFSVLSAKPRSRCCTPWATTPTSCSTPTSTATT